MIRLIAILVLAALLTGCSSSIQTPPAATPAAAAIEKAPEQAQVTVYVTRTGSKYQRAGCSYLKSSSPMSLEDAKLRYGPCSRCSPPR